MIRSKLPVGLAMLAGILAACGGGGHIGSPLPQPSSAPSSSPTAPATPPGGAPTTFAFHIITLSTKLNTVVTVHSQTPIAPPGFSFASPVPNAVVTYADGSTQTANAQGGFQTATSSYAQNNMMPMQYNAAAAPIAFVADPLAQAVGSVLALGPAFSPSSNAPILGVELSPLAATANSGDTILLALSAVTLDGAAISPNNPVIAWSSAKGASVQGISGTNEALYVAPVNPGADTATASFAAPGGPTFTAQALITTLDPTTGVAVSGKAQSSTGQALTNTTIGFINEQTSRVFPAQSILTQSDSSGNYAVALAPTTTYNIAFNVPAAQAPNGNAATLGAVDVSAGNAPQLTTGAAGTMTANLALPSTPSDFSDSHDDANTAYPDPILTTRDATAAQTMLQVYPFWADSGVLGLFLQAPNTNPPQTVNAGLFADWCYQWQTIGGTMSLVLIENASATCTSPGNLAFTASSVGGGASSFAFSQYRATSGGFSLSSPLASQLTSPTSLLVASGTWQQNVTSTNGEISNDTVQASITSYGALGFTPGVSQSNATLTYSYALGSGLATATISSANLVDNADGLGIASMTATLAQQEPLTACAGKATACYTGSGSLSRDFNLVSGPSMQVFSVTSSLSGDGSASLKLAGQMGDSSSLTLPIASTGTRASGSCIVCTSVLGGLGDTDGTTQLGSFSIDAGGFVKFSLLNTLEGQPTGRPVATLTFAE